MGCEIPYDIFPGIKINQILSNDFEMMASLGNLVSTLTTGTTKNGTIIPMLDAIGELFDPR